MSDISIPEASGEASASVSDTTAGLLRATREGKGLSLEEVAHALKLQPRQITAMEEGDFKALGSSPHVRGFVRNYARHMGMDPQSVLGLLERQAPLPTHELQGPGDTGVSMPVPGGRKPMAWALAASPLVLVALGAGILYALGVNFDRWRTVSGETPPAQSVPAPVVAPVAVAVSPALPAPAGVSGSVPAAPIAGIVSAQPSPGALPVAAPLVPAPVFPPATPTATPPTGAPAVAPQSLPATPVAAANTRRIVLNFLKESWIEVKQGDGRILISEKMRGGNTRILEGRPPFTLVIGAASGVQVQYDDRAVDLAPHTKVDVARLTLN